MSHLRTILALITLFLALDLDFLVAAKTCATMSWKNAVEKIMCILNLALYGVVLERVTMYKDMEDARRAAGASMEKIRAHVNATGEDGEKLQTAIMQSVQPMRELLQARFRKLSLKGRLFTGTLGDIATQDQMLDMLALVTIIEPKITRDASNLNLKTATLKTMKGLRAWVDVHVTQSPYHVVIGKYCQASGTALCCTAL